jgi:putative ABC transport system substrate-binding protein
MPLIGFLSGVSSDGFAARLRGFRDGLKEAGYVEGENVAIEYRWAENQLDRLPALAADLVRRQVAVIFAGGGNLPAITAKAATRTIPIVFGASDDPAKLGLVDSLPRPGGNATGVNFFVSEVVAKRLALLRELLPSVTRIAMLVNSSNMANAESAGREAGAAARTMGLDIRVFAASSSREINVAFATIVQDRSDAFFAAPDPFFLDRRVQLASLTLRYAIPSSFPVRDMVEAGGLMSYGTDITHAFRQAAVYVGRILKGAKPADLPVVQSTKFELAINLQTATLLGVEVPPMLLARADVVIE